MATEVDICNTALSLLGCRADIASISPVEGGRFAEVCAREYPIARNLVLEAHDWSFACRRANLAVLRTDLFGWQFGYVRPADAVSIVAVVPEDDRYFEPARIHCGGRPGIRGEPHPHRSSGGCLSLSGPRHKHIPFSGAVLSGGGVQTRDAPFWKHHQRNARAAGGGKP